MHRRAFLFATLLPSSANAHSYRAGTIAVGHAWALPSRSSEAQMFLPLVNNGSERDELVAARSQISSFIELRRNNRYDDPPLTSIGLDPGRPVPMRPRALHLRLVGLKRRLDKGDRFGAILDFLNAGEVQIEVMVEDTPGA